MWWCDVEVMVWWCCSRDFRDGGIIIGLVGMVRKGCVGGDGEEGKCCGCGGGGGGEAGGGCGDVVVWWWWM